MINKTYSVTLELKTPVSIQCFDVVMGDTQNVFEFTLRDGQLAIDLTDLTPTLVFSSEMGIRTIDTSCGVTITDAQRGEFSAAIPSNAFSEGNVLCQLSLLDENGLVATSTCFSFRCIAPLLSEEAIAAQPNVSMLQALLPQINSALTLLAQRSRVDIDISNELVNGDYEGAVDFMQNQLESCSLRIFDGEFYYYFDCYRDGTSIQQQYWSTEESILIQYLRAGAVIDGVVSWQGYFHCTYFEPEAYVRKSGGLMTGALRLRTPSNNAYLNNEAVPKSYVDAAIAAAVANE